MPSRIRRHLIRVAVLLAALMPATAGAAEALVAVAANFAAPMKRIAAAFEQDTGHRALLAFGSTGKLYAQIRAGAPFDLLLAADDATCARLAAEGLGIAASRFTYAVGRLALWSPDPALVDDNGDILRRGGFARLALADPRLAPYGAAAIATIDAMQLRAALETRFVYGESISQTYQFVASGNAELGFVALSQLIANGRIARGSAWIVPQQMHPPILQAAIALGHGRDNEAAAAFLGYLKGGRARAIIRAFGYGIG